MPNPSINNIPPETGRMLGEQEVINVADKINEISNAPVGITVIKGIATGGSSTTIVDDTKDFTPNMLTDSWVKMLVSDKEYVREVSSNGANTITIPIIEPAVAASCQLFYDYDYAIGVNYDVAGAAGNTKRIIVTAETGEGHENVNLGAVLADGIITVTLGTDANGALDAAKNEAILVAGAIDAITNFTSIPLATESEPVVTYCDIGLSGGADAYGASEGTVYEVLLSNEAIVAAISAVIAEIAKNDLIVLVKGTTDAVGSPGLLVDTTKDFGTNFEGQLIKVVIDGMPYYRDITVVLGSGISFTPIQLATSASVTLTGEGSLDITVLEPEEAGNDYTIQLVAGTGVSSPMAHTLVDKALTITSATDGAEAPIEFLAGNVQSYIDNDAELSLLFDADNSFTAGSLALMDNPTSFTGGQDDIVVPSGAEYEILDCGTSKVQLITGTSNAGKFVPIDADGDEKFTQTNPASIIGSVALTGSDGLKGAVATVLAAGTRVQLPNFPCQEVTVIALRANTGFIYAGGNDVSSAVYGVSMTSEQSFTFFVSNANMIYIDASISGEGISYVAV